jgi:subfamily B ATP-binding cassette protein MsbA
MSDQPEETTVSQDPNAPGDNNMNAADMNAAQIYKRLLSYVGPFIPAFVVSMLGYLIFAVTTPATAAWLGWTIDQIEAQNDAARIMAPLLCVLIVLVRGVGGFMGNYALEYVANHVVHRLRCQVLDQLMSVPLGYYDKNSMGRLVSKVTYDVLQIKGAATNAVTVVLREGMTVIGLLAWLFWVNWRLSMVFLLVAPCMAFIVHLATKRYRRYSKQMQDSMGDVTQLANETIKGQRVIRTFNATDFVSGRFGQSSERNRRQNMKMVATQATATPLIQVIVSVAMAILIWLALGPEFLGNASAGDVVTFLTLAGMLSKPLRQLSGVNAIIQRGISASYSIFELLDAEQEQDQGTHQVERVKGEIELRDVSFAYDIKSDTKPPVLAHINLKVRAGTTLALVGRSGSGKSTLVNLLPRFYDITAGEITLDGTELASYQLSNLRQQIAIVSQDVVLFEGTVADNIAYGVADQVSKEQIVAAAKNAHADEFIRSLPLGYDSPVGDGGNLLSGGQRQRLAIARAFLKDAPVLILDEATSALDTESEQHIQQALNQLMRGRTTFVIAHRLSTIENADEIVVMEQGRIVEQGSHQVLLEKKGHYARLHRMQFNDGLDDVIPGQDSAGSDTISNDPSDGNASDAVSS